MLFPEIQPFPGCPPLDGYHCVTNALAKIFLQAGHPLSEDLLLGLGSGMGFIYWRMKGNPALGIPESLFVGGRDSRSYLQDLSERTGVTITETTTASAKKGEAMLLERLERQEPVMLYGDMGLLPWFHFPAEYHFGGHTFVICGYDGEDRLLASDMDPQSAGLKKGFYHEITREQLRLARNSAHKPFPPTNGLLSFDFNGFHAPDAEDFLAAIRLTADRQLHPPIKNFGIKGIRHTSCEILKWPKQLSDKELREQLFNLYIFIEIGGTGGGCFRTMYSRFLREGAAIAGCPALEQASERIDCSGRLFTQIGLLFKEAETIDGIEERVKQASRLYLEIADIEEDAFQLLSTL